MTTEPPAAGRPGPAQSPSTGTRNAALPPAPAAARRVRRRSVLTAAALVLPLTLGAAASLVPLPYVVLTPGPITDVLGSYTRPDGSTTERIVVQDHPTYPTTGSLDFTTVRLVGGPGSTVNVVDVITAWIDPADEVVPVDQVFRPDQTSQQVAEENRAMMRDSQREAAAVAVRAAGGSVGTRVLVADVPDGSPAAGVVQAGDVFVSVAGIPSTDAEAVRAGVRTVAPGATVEVVVERGGQQVTLQPTTGRARDGRTILGVSLRLDVTLPYPVTIDAGNVGGPSAGLMFALGVYDKLTDGALTGGNRIAGTGTIDLSGEIGPIDGIAQKMVGARRGGARFFLAPADNCPAVVGHEPSGLTVVKVATFDEARVAVQAIAASSADRLPRC